MVNILIHVSLPFSKPEEVPFVEPCVLIRFEIERG